MAEPSTSPSTETPIQPEKSIDTQEKNEEVIDDKAPIERLNDSDELESRKRKIGETVEVQTDETTSLSLTQKRAKADLVVYMCFECLT
jgi:hypothetical protein